MLRRSSVASFIVASVILSACTTISPYNEKAYENATSVKAEAVKLIGEANEPYSLHKKDVDSLELNAGKAEEFAKGLPKNAAISKQYEIVLNKNGGLLYGALEKWKAKGKLSDIEIAEFSKQIGKEFDQIIGLEQGKNKL